MQTIFSILGIAFMAYLFIVGFMYIWQRKILYLPVRELVKPTNYGLYDMEEKSLKTDDGVVITVWHQQAHKHKPTIIYFHGNAGNLGDRIEKIQAFLDQDFGFIAVSYRGYGSSGGSPTEVGFYHDAHAAINFAIKELGIHADNLILYGESLGSGVATKMATEYPVLALVLEAPYTSIADRAAELYPFLPVKFLLHDDFNNIDIIGKVTAPVLIFHGYLDDVTPIPHGRKVLEKANEPKEARFFDHVGHTDFHYPTLAKAVEDFVSEQK